MSHEQRPYNPFSGAFLDRRSESRQQADWIDAARRGTETLFIAGRGTLQLLSREPAAQIAFLSAHGPLVARAADTDLVLLGWHAGRQCVLVETLADAPELPSGTGFGE